MTNKSIPYNPETAVVLDFETYFSKDYSLKKLNTSGYVRSPEFLIHGVGIKVGVSPAYYVPGHSAAIAALRALNLEQRTVVAHNMPFDGFVLHEHLDIHPAQYCDTLGMARALMGHHMKHDLDTVATTLGFPGKLKDILAQTKGLRVLPPELAQQLGEYCANDVERCADVFRTLLPFMPEKELQLLDITLRMFCQPILEVDQQLVAQVQVEERHAKTTAVADAGCLERQLSSNQQFADLLRQHGVEPPTKISPRTGKTTYAFAQSDPGFKALELHDDEAVQFLVSARKLVKSTIKETRAERLRTVGPNLPVLLNYAGAHTYRWSGGNKINLQNFPRGSRLRRAILAPIHHAILVHDQAQIEARLNCWFCGQNDILTAFAAYDRGVGESVYRLMAARIYAKAPDRVTETERQVGKIAVLGLGYGMGWRKLRLMLLMDKRNPIQVSEGEAQRIVNMYRAANPYIVAMQQRLNLLLLQMTQPSCDIQLGPLKFLYKMVELPSGLALKYPGLRIVDGKFGPETVYYSRYGTTKIYGGLFLENIIQALARCTIGEQMLQVPYKIAMMSHDEIATVVHEDQAETAWEEIRQLMLVPPAWAPGLPLNVSGGWDRCYSK